MCEYVRRFFPWRRSKQQSSIVAQEEHKQDSDPTPVFSVHTNISSEELTQKVQYYLTAIILPSKAKQELKLKLV